MSRIDLLQGVLRCKVVRYKSKRRFLASSDTGFWIWLRPNEEGTVWARGWTTKAAKALQAHVALERSR